MATAKLELTVQGRDRAEMEESAWGIAGLYYGDDEYDIVSSSNARYVEDRGNYAIVITDTPGGFEADFTFTVAL